MIVAPLTTPHPPLAQQDQHYYYPLYPTITHYPHTYNFMPSSSSDCFDAELQHGGKRVKVEQHQQEHFQHNQPLLSYFPESTLDYSSFHTATGLNQSHLHPPQLNFDKASEQPGSPLTVTTTLSQYSTPSRSPTRVSILSDTAHSDWGLFDDSMTGTLTHDIPKDRNTNPFHSNQLQVQNTSVTSPSTTTSDITQDHMRSAFSYPMNSTTVSGQYYAGFPLPNFTKLSQHPVLNPYGPPPTPGNQHTENNYLHQHHEEDLPALSPSNRYHTSNNQMAREDLRSPITPLGSPLSNDGDRAQNARTSAPREDTQIYIFDDEMDDSLLFPPLDIHNPLPKFTRTVSDAVEDELFRSSPLEAPKSHTSQKHQTNTPISPTLATYFQQAQKDHLLDSTRNNTQHGFVSREKSPFRANSPFHPTRTPQGVQVTPVRRNVINYITAQGKREQQQELDMQSISQHMMMNEPDQLSATPKTISPKDALLDYPEPEDEASKLSLFPHEHHSSHFGNSANSHTQSHNHSHYQSADAGDGNDSEISYPGGSRRGSEAESIGSIGAYSYHHSPLMQQNLPFPFQTLGSSTEVGSTSLQDKGNEPHSPTSSKPEGSRADSGAYTCTVPGCQQRFQTPAKLQKHRRENHRQSSPAGPSGMTSALQGGANRLQGPHRCARINPTTGKPCNTIFSRPYDLTRHDDTIHNTTREKVRCDICNDEKTFSRQDALTRHKKVKHGIDK